MPPVLVSPHRLGDQDVGLSSPRPEFESPWGHRSDGAQPRVPPAGRMPESPNNENYPLPNKCLRRAGTDIAALWLQPERTRADGRTGTGKPKRNRVAGVAVDARRHATESACDCDQR